MAEIKVMIQIPEELTNVLSEINTALQSIAAAKSCSCKKSAKAKAEAPAPEHPVDNVVPFPDPAPAPEAPAPERTFTLKEIQAAVMQLATISEAAKANVKTVLSHYEVERVSELPSEKYASFMADLDALK